MLDAVEPTRELRSQRIVLIATLLLSQSGTGHLRIAQGGSGTFTADGGSLNVGSVMRLADGGVTPLPVARVTLRNLTLIIADNGLSVWSPAGTPVLHTRLAPIAAWLPALICLLLVAASTTHSLFSTIRIKRSTQ